MIAHSTASHPTETPFISFNLPIFQQIDVAGGSKLEATLPMKPSSIHDSIYMTMKNDGRTGMAVEACDSEDYAEIISGLFVGTFTSAESLLHPRKPPKALEGVTHVLSVCSEPLFSSSMTPTPTFKHLHVPIVDNEEENLLVHLESAVGFIVNALNKSTCQSGIEEPKGKVLVHCAMGVSRSVSVVCAYLMARWRCSPGAALNFVRRRRPQAQPNYGFMKQLYIWAEANYGSLRHIFIESQGSSQSNGSPRLTSHLSYLSWLKRRKREVKSLLTRVEDTCEVEVKIDGEEEGTVISILEDFPTDPLEAAFLVGEMDVGTVIVIGSMSLPTIPSQTKNSSPTSRLVSMLEPIALSQVQPPASSQRMTSLRLAVPPPDGRATPPYTHSPGSTSPISGVSTSSSNTPSWSGGCSPATPSSLFSRNGSFGSISSTSSSSSTCTPSVDHSTHDSNRPIGLGIEDPDWLTLAGHGAPVKLIQINSDDLGENEWLHRSSEIIRTAIMRGGVRRTYDRNILICCKSENRACAAVCAWLVDEQGLGMDVRQAMKLLEESLPLFSPRASFKTTIEEYAKFSHALNLISPIVRTPSTEEVTKPRMPQQPRFHVSGEPELDIDTLISQHLGSWEEDSDTEIGRMGNNRSRRGSWCYNASIRTVADVEAFRDAVRRGSGK